YCSGCLLFERLIPHPVLARFETTPQILFHDQREIALLTVTVHKQDGGDQLVAVSLNSGWIKHFSGIGSTVPGGDFVSVPRVGGKLVHQDEARRIRRPTLLL